MQNTAYFLQGLLYPINSLGGWLHYAQRVHDMTAVALLSGLGLFVAVLVQLTNRSTLRSLLPWLWTLLASLPAILFLVFEYVINGPRLLMVASVGVAWLWADVILLFSRGGQRGSIERLFRVGITILFTFLLLAQNISFLRERMIMHEILGDGFEQVVAATAEANAAGQEAVVINFPSWLAPKKHSYALGHEGVLFWPDYVPPQIFMAVHTGELGDLNFVKVDGIRPDLEAFYYGLTGPNPDWEMLSAVPSQVLKTEYGTESIALNPVGSLGDHRQEQLAPLASFMASGTDGSIQLLDAQVIPEEGGIRIETLWQATDVPQQTTLFVHVVDAAGNLITQADGDPLGGSYPLDLWSGGSRVLDTRRVDLEEISGLGVRVGLYDRLSGSRLEAREASGGFYADNAVPLGTAAP